MLHTTGGSLASVVVNPGSPVGAVNLSSSILTTPFAATAGTTYWITIFNGAADASWNWLVADAAGNGARQGTNPGPPWDRPASDLVVPAGDDGTEPATIALLGGGLAFAAARRARARGGSKIERCDRNRHRSGELLAALAVVAVAAGLISIGAQPSAQTAPAPLTVMSFNIRYGTANDGPNHWTSRREMLLDVIRDAQADVIGVQEALDAQLREIVAALPQYAVLGVGRDDGRTRGEYAAILFRRDRLHVSDTGTFWFSDTPEVVASRSWGNTITRICTWARFIDSDGRAFWHYNVHLDHQSQPSRERSVQLLAERVGGAAISGRAGAHHRRLQRR